MNINEKLAECVGLWLAEGDSKSELEITFSNNCWELVELFHKTLRKLFSKYNPKIRIYVYNSTKKQINIPIKNVQVNHYVDKRATKPYYIWRLASVDLVRKWREIVEKSKDNEKLYAEILRGFFAGEGNIKIGSHKNRTIRISQGKPSKLIETILNKFRIDYRYYPRERSYIITHKTNWDKCAKIKIADSHPLKKSKFWETYLSFKEEHYKHNYLKKSIFGCLVKPYTSKELSIKLNRSQARIYDVLDLFKKEENIENFRVRSKDYWIRKDQKIIIISRLKHNYLNFLGDLDRTTKDFSKRFKVDWKSSFRRLKELEKLGLVKRNQDKIWRRLNVTKKVIPL